MTTALLLTDRCDHPMHLPLDSFCLKIPVGDTLHVFPPLPGKYTIQDGKLVFSEYDFDIKEARTFLSTGYDHKIQKQTDYTLVLAKLEDVTASFKTFSSTDELVKFMIAFECVAAPITDYKLGGWFYKHAEIVLYMGAEYHDLYLSWSTL